MVKRLGIGGVVLVLVGCGEYDLNDYYDGATSELRKGLPGAINGQPDYCDDPANPCLSGEGDCDADSQCTGAGIVCGTANGLAWNQWWSNDVCHPSTCENGMMDPFEIEIDNGGNCGCWLRTYYFDFDVDGYGRAANRVFCDGMAPANWTLTPGDCADGNAAVNPGATEVCGNSVDEDCDTVLDNGCTVETWCLDSDLDTYPRSTGCVMQVGQPAYNWVAGATEFDCNDSNAAVNPGATEVCGNSVDEDCDTVLDNGCMLTTWCLDADLDAYPRSTGCVMQIGQPAYNWLATSGVTQYDCDDSNAAVNPAATEVCNEIDDNCDTFVDEGVTTTWYLDNDLDTYPRNLPTDACTQPAFNWVQDGTFSAFDCIDTNPSVNPGAPEICGDGLDNDCNGMIDDSCTVPAHCTNGMLDGNETGVDCGGFCDVCSAGAAPTSCAGGLNTCGPAGNRDCCAASTVFGEDYIRSYDAVGFTDTTATATVYSYVLDEYEVTVGRFKQFLASYDTWIASNPTAGDGAHPLITGTGWDATWNASLPADAATLVSNLNCTPHLPTYDASSVNDDLPITCATWYEAFAFCVWDGGRLPTEAEWNLAAAAGGEQRVYPWSDPATSTTITTTESAFGCFLDGDFSSCTINDVASVGLLSAGNGPRGHADLGGNAWEWTFDYYDATYPLPCVNCANTTTATFRAIRGGGYTSLTDNIRVGTRSIAGEGNRSGALGFRCARGG